MGRNTTYEEEIGEAQITLAGDERWELVQRIIRSRGFERASQIRKILLYVTQAAIENPNRVIREYEIACDVLERRQGL